MADLTWPADLQTGTIQGRWTHLRPDGPDTDRTPDRAAAVGSVTIEPSQRTFVYAGPDGAEVAIGDGYTGVLDSQGYLCTPNADGTAGPRGMVVYAVDSPGLSPTGFTYRVTFAIEGAQIEPFYIAVPAGSVVDLALVTRVAASAGTQTTVDVSTALRAEAAALRAEAAAQAAQGGSGDSGSASSAASSAQAADTSAKAAAASASTASTARADAVTAQGAAESAASSASESATAAASSATAAQTAQAKAEQAAASSGGGGGGGGTVSTTAGPGTVAAAAGWTLSGLRNVRAGQVGQISFRVTSPSSAQGAGEWVVATATTPLNALCPVPLQPVTWCADTTDQLTGTGLWEKATGRIRLHCNIGLASSVPLVVSCVYISS